MGATCGSGGICGTDTAMDRVYSNLYEKYGGQPTINALIDHLYAKIMRNSALAGKFTGKNIEKIKTAQKIYWAAQLGAENVTYTGRTIDEIHKPLNITNIEFDQVGNLLLEASAELGVHAIDLPKIRALWDKHRADIVKL